MKEILSPRGWAFRERKSSPAVETRREAAQVKDQSSRADGEGPSLLRSQADGEGRSLLRSQAVG